MSFATEIQFNELCNSLETIIKLKSPQQRFNELNKFVDFCRTKIKDVKSKANNELSLFPIMRLLLPGLERERGPYGLKTKALTDLYLRTFCIGKKSQEAQKLINYREPTNNEKKGSDFPETVYFVIRSRLPNRASQFTIEQINSFLDNIAQRHSSNQSKDDIFKNYLLEMNALEIKWITKIINKDLKLGITQKNIFKALHPDAEKLFIVQSSLKDVCDKLLDPTVRINSTNEAKIELFSHFKPMLLEMCNIDRTGKFFQEDEKRYFVQTKHDGERSQLHMKNGTFKYFTRQGFDITNKTMYGENQSSGAFLTTNISNLLNQKCKFIILDGEMMGYHKKKKKFGSKGENYDVKNLKETSAHQPCFVAFDVILYNDELLLDKPYYERLKILQSAFTEKEGVLQRSETKMISSSKELLDLFNTSLDNNEEGIVLKKYDFTYKPNVRVNTGCYKIKAEYSDKLINEIDCVILGGYYGEGKWSGLCNSFLVGIADTPLQKGSMPATFQAIVSVGNGFKHEFLKELNEQFKKLWKKRCPSNVIGPKNELPTVWLDPKDSIVVELKASEIIKSKDYPFGYTLRFPRVVRIREDKPWYSICTTNEFHSFIKNADMIQKLTKRHATDEDMNESIQQKVSKAGNFKKRESKIDETTLCVNPNTVTRLTRLFNNKEFCVIINNHDVRLKIERLLLQHMAKITAHPRPETFCIIVENPKWARSSNIIQSQKYDVASVNWLKRVTRKENWKYLHEFYPWELFSMKRSTKERLSKLFDDYYDSYNVDATSESLQKSIEKAEEFTKTDDITDSSMKELDEELFENGVSPFSLFRNKIAYFHESLQVEKSIFQFLGGKIIREEPNRATYVIINNNTDNSKLLAKLNKFVFVVSHKWVDDCFTKKNLLPIESYLIKN